MSEFAFAGNFNPWNSQVYNQGDNGNWWSSTVKSSDNAYNLNANSNGNVNPSDNNNRVNGNSVRCVAGS